MRPREGGNQEQAAEVAPAGDKLGDTNASAFNLAAAANNIPNQKISADILNKVSNNFRAYDDFMIFQSGLPPSMTPPLRRDQTNAQTEPHPLLSQLPQDPNDENGDFGVGFNPLGIPGTKPEAGDHQIAQDIDRVMKENFEYEQNTIETLFQRYQQYKPIISGMYGQDVVHDTVHLQPREDDFLADDGLPKTQKEIETRYLIEVMKHNHDMINVTEKYQVLKDNYHGVNQDAVDITGDAGGTEEDKVK